MSLARTSALRHVTFDIRDSILLRSSKSLELSVLDERMPIWEMGGRTGNLAEYGVCALPDSGLKHDIDDCTPGRALPRREEVGGVSSFSFLHRHRTFEIDGTTPETVVHSADMFSNTRGFGLFSLGYILLTIFSSFSVSWFRLFYSITSRFMDGLVLIFQMVYCHGDADVAVDVNSLYSNIVWHLLFPCVCSWIVYLFSSYRQCFSRCPWVGIFQLSSRRKLFLIDSSYFCSITLTFINFQLHSIRLNIAWLRHYKIQHLVHTEY